MKRTIRLTALLGIGFLLGACTEDDIIKNYGPKDCVGDEIVFGVSTASDTKTRTVYGDASASERKVEVNWVKGDMLMIACPQAAGTRLAHYQVTADKEMDQEAGVLNGYSETSIQKAEGEDVSLQWGAGDGENGFHDFYAVYPSSKKQGMSPTEDGDKPYVTMNNEGFVGYLPLDQSVPAASVVEKDGNIIVNPNMDIAYMVAKTLDVTRGGDVELKFGSLNTVLQFQIHRGDIANNITDVGAIMIHGASLFSANKKAICGLFNYKFADESCTSLAEVASSYSRVTLSLPEAKELTENNYCDLTFFILPTYENEDITVGDYDDGINEMNDLQLQVMYSVGGSPQLKTATIKADIQASTKHLFKDVKLPKIESGVTGSNWFNGLADDIYISQLSIPVAGNAFSNGSEAAYKEQTKSYTDLWNSGVRGFEICTYNLAADSSSIGGAPIISGGKGVGVTVSVAFEYLYSQLGDETLVLVFTPRHASNQGFGSFAPNVFVKQIETYLSEFMEKEGITNKGDLFVKLSSGSCVGDLKGKIAIVVRPGDNDYITNLGVSKATVSEEWDDYLTVIDDWGTAEDQWGDRYGAFFDQAGYYTANAGKSVFENQYLKYRVDTKDSWSNSWSNGTESGSYPASVAAANKNYKRLINNNESDIAYVQCWERVVQAETAYMPVHTNGGNFPLSGSRLNIKWFESYEEKKAMAQYIAEQAASQKGQTHSPLYINSLCGFFIDINTNFSYMPNLNGTSFGSYSYTPSKGGTGGDFKSCAANLNYWFYNLLANSTNQGPYGLVMLDYIGATATELSGFVTKETGITAELAAQACQNLPLLIMMNNFKFPLATNPDYGKTVNPATQKLSDTPAKEGEALAISWRR